MFAAINSVVKLYHGFSSNCNDDCCWPPVEKPCSRWILALPSVFPCKNMKSSTVIACLSSLFCVFGFPSCVHSDGGSPFVSQETRTRTSPLSSFLSARPPPTTLLGTASANGSTKPFGEPFNCCCKLSWVKKCLGHMVCTLHNRCFHTCYWCKIWASLRKFFASLVSQAGYGSASDCCLVNSVSYATQLSLFTIKFSGLFNIKF